MKTTIMSYRFSSFILLPLCTGTGIYSVGLAIPFPHQSIEKYTPLSDWFVHCVPHGLWMLAILNAYQFLFIKHSFLKKWLWLTAITGVTMIGHFAFSLHSGITVYDLFDLFFYQYSFLFSAVILSARDLKKIFINL